VVQGTDQCNFISLEHTFTSQHGKRIPTQTLSCLPSETCSIGYVEYVIRCSPGGQCSAYHPCKVLFFRSLLRSVLRVRACVRACVRDIRKKSVVWRQHSAGLASRPFTRDWVSGPSYRPCKIPFGHARCCDPPVAPSPQSEGR